MTRRFKAVQALLPKKWKQEVDFSEAFAPVNIALVKYWGKRDDELILPVTDSFSVSLDLGTTTKISRFRGLQDEVFLNGKRVEIFSSFFEKIFEFLNLVRPDPSFTFSIDTKNTVPTAAGLASSASGFAALALSLNMFFGWNLNTPSLSILARLGSGSACRSVLPGFMHWKKGEREDGSDSYAEPFLGKWEDLCLGVLYVDTHEKEVSSRVAMKRSQMTSPLYQAWKDTVEKNLKEVFEGIKTRDFCRFGQAVEQNALAMHATMLTAVPVISFFKEKTIVIMNTVWQARKEGVFVFFTMDAGPNVKILFLEKDKCEIQKRFPNVSIISLF
jgi:diphosphomevalonate decarboxylase